MCICHLHARLNHHHTIYCRTLIIICKLLFNSFFMDLTVPKRGGECHRKLKWIFHQFNLFGVKRSEYSDANHTHTHSCVTYPVVPGFCCNFLSEARFYRYLTGQKKPSLSLELLKLKKKKNESLIKSPYLFSNEEFFISKLVLFK